MILGIGTDIIEIERLDKAVLNNGFLEKIYTETEIKLFKTKKIETLAGNFCAKEAVSKALGTGFRGFSPKDIEILRTETGKPYANLSGGALETFDKLNGKNIFVTISHCKKYATAYVIIEC